MLNIKKKKGFSLLEIIVSITIISFAIVVMMRFLVFSIQITKASVSRSLVRDDISNISNLIARDIRNANNLGACSASSCTIYNDKGDKIVWNLVKSKVNETITSAVTGLNLDAYDSSSNVIINSLDFSPGYINNTKSNMIQNIIVTINASHSNANLNIKNIINQISVSTRNLNVIQ